MTVQQLVDRLDDAITALERIAGAFERIAVALEEANRKRGDW